MDTSSIRFHCRHCQARLKAPVQLGGRHGNCPRCAEAFMVPRVILNVDGATFVMLEKSDRFVLRNCLPNSVETN